MKIIRNTLKAELDCWSDPGDYPSNAGSGPLPDGPLQVVEVNGEVVIRITPSEFKEWLIVGLEDFLENTDGIDIPDGVLSVGWQIDSVVFLETEYEITLSCENIESDPSWRKDDYDGREDYDE